MKLDKVINKYNELIFGHDTEFDLQKRVFLLITHISIIIGIVALIVNIILDLGVFLTITTASIILLVVFFHVKVRRNKLELKYSISFFILSLLAFSFVWFYNGGYNGNNIILIVVYFTVIIAILPSNFRFFALVCYAVLISLLTITHFTHPELITHYKSEEERFVDLIIGYFLYLVLAYVIQTIILKHYESNRIKINNHNEQLNELVCELNDTNDQLEETIKYAEELNASKDRFITILSHDLRSPFQGLLGITKTLTTEYNSFTDKEKRLYITQVNNSVEKIYSFLEELLLWGRVQKNAVKLTYESTVVKELVSETVSLLLDSAAKKKISIEIVCDGFLNAVLDKEMIAIVLRNLISNAIKFSTVGGKIVIDSHLEGDYIKISVMDNGVGISDDIIPKLFKLDENITTIGTDGEQGSGMGLILCNDILKKHKGEISVQSKEGRGSTFTIIISQHNN